MDLWPWDSRTEREIRGTEQLGARGSVTCRGHGQLAGYI